MQKLNLMRRISALIRPTGGGRFDTRLRARFAYNGVAQEGTKVEYGENLTRVI